MGSDQYNVKYSSMDQFYIELCTKTQEWYNQLDSWKASYTGVINMTSFNGQSSTAVKSYLGEVHEFLLQSIYVAISRFQSEFLLYKNGYYNIEDNIYANMSRDTIKSIQDRISNEIKYLNNIANEIDISLNSVSDIYWRGKPSKSTLEGHLNSEKNSLSAFNTSIENYESNKYAAGKGELRSLLEALKSTIILYSGSTNSVLSYKSGDLINNTEVLDLYKKVQSSIEYVENNKEEIELAAVNQQEVFSQMQKDYEEALEAKEDAGRVKLITGSVAILAGGAAIILTAGAATPIVVTAAVAGTSSMVYGASNMVEGGQDVYYASIGDLESVSINPIRDTVFMGNQSAYDIWGSLNMAVAGLSIPVGYSINGVAGASKYIIAKTAATTIGKEVALNIGLDFVGSNLTNFATNQFDLNMTESTLLNLGLSFGLDRGVAASKPHILGAAPFAEGMNYDDAMRYNDYWNRIESGNNTGYPGLADVDIKAWRIADARLNEHISVSKVNPNDVVNLRMEALKLENGLRAVDNGSSKSDLYGELNKITDSQGRFEYLLDKAKTMDVSTEKNGAIFYAGRIENVHGTITAREVAERYADQLFKEKGVVKLTLERTPGGKWMDDLKLYEKTNGVYKYEKLGLTLDQANEIWRTLSSRYADGANGAVTAFTKNVPEVWKPRTIFWSTELPQLRNNPNVKHINIR